MYESRHHQPISRRHFTRRLSLHAAVALGVIAGSLVIGMTGYIYFEHLSCLDAFLNASMLLGGMGPVNTPQTNGGKLFAGFYALYSGLVVLIAAAIILTPVFHRMLHKFHWDDKK